MSTQTRFNIRMVNQGGTMAVRIDGPTNLELALYAMLEDSGIKYRREYQVGPYRLDAFAPKLICGWSGPGRVRGDPHGSRIGFEADGPLHFTPSGRRRDRIRDANILATGKVDAIARFDARLLSMWLS